MSTISTAGTLQLSFCVSFFLYRSLQPILSPWFIGGSKGGLLAKEPLKFSPKHSFDPLVTKDNHEVTLWKKMMDEKFVTEVFQSVLICHGCFAIADVWPELLKHILLETVTVTGMSSHRFTKSPKKYSAVCTSTGYWLLLLSCLIAITDFQNYQKHIVLEFSA